jgi:hypothetical protein
MKRSKEIFKRSRWKGVGSWEKKRNEGRKR